MKLKKTALAISLGLSSTLAMAGFVQPAEVMVDLVGETAQGDQWTARNEADDAVYIGCGLRAYDDGAGGVFRWGFCQAIDADGDEVVCNTENPGLIDAIGAQDDFSFIVFSWRTEVNDAGEKIQVCDHIGSSTQSFYLPRSGFKAN